MNNIVQSSLYFYIPYVVECFNFSARKHYRTLKFLYLLIDYPSNLISDWICVDGKVQIVLDQDPYNDTKKVKHDNMIHVITVADDAKSFFMAFDQDRGMCTLPLKLQ